MSKPVNQKPSMLGKVMFAGFKAVYSLLMLPIDALRYKMAKPEQKPVRKMALMNRLPWATGAVVAAAVLVPTTKWVKHQVDSGVNAAQTATHDIAEKAKKLLDDSKGGVTTTPLPKVPPQKSRE